MPIIKSFTAYLAVASIALSGAAQAAKNHAEDWGTHGLLEAAQVTHNGKGLFVDTFSFFVASPSNLLTTIFSFGNIAGDVELYKGDVANIWDTDTLIDSFTFSGASALSQTHNFADLTTGNYYYKIDGGLGKGGTKHYGLASFTTATASAPVPEPETYAMLLAGLGVVGIAARRRVK
jgi:hypothetical protein